MEGKMAQQFNPQNVKTRYSTLIFIKGSTAPLVMYVEDYQSLYEELTQAMKNTTPVIIEKETAGPLKKVSFVSNQIAAVAIQEEQYM